LTSFRWPILAVTDPAREPRHGPYETLDLLISRTDALNEVETYQYDPAGDLAFVTDRKGQVRGYTYDLLGRLTQAGFGAASTASPVYDSMT
jgi:YD repeat-containing protein